ncbi:MAG: trigger factor [Armatimonadetes bacterium]|nr:trigger factor [Armatimonadota bacterium]
MQFKREDLNPCTIKFEVTCTADQVKSGYDRAYKGFAKQMRVPGFRPGTAPKAMVKKLVDPQQVTNAAAEEIIGQALKDLLTAEKIQPHDSPAVNILKIEEEEPVCEFTAKIPLKPQVELGDYKTLTVSRPNVEVSDKDVDEYLETLRQKSGKREVVTERGATDGDMAVVNIRVDGEEGEGRNFMTVVGKTFPKLDKALEGMRAEEMKVETLEFPADFQEKDWAGKKEKVKVTLKSITTIQTPELDDDFAQNLQKDLKSLKSETLADLKAKVKDLLTRAREQMSQEYVNEALQQQLLDLSTVHVPDTMWESVASQRLRELEAEARQNGKTLEDYAKSNGMTLEEMIESWNHEAKIQVQRAVIAREIFALERLQLTNEDLNQSLIQMAMEYNVPAPQLLEYMQKNKSFQELEIRAVFKKVIDFLNSNATITAGEAAPAPKKVKASAKAADESGDSTDKPKKSPKKKAE